MTDGFTLIELLVYISVSTILVGASAFISLTGYERALRNMALHTNEMLAEYTQGMALRHVCEERGCVHGAMHGMANTATSSIIFEDDRYLHRDIYTEHEVPIHSPPGNGSTIVYSALVQSVAGI